MSLYVKFLLSAVVFFFFSFSAGATRYQVSHNEGVPLELRILFQDNENQQALLLIDSLDSLWNADAFSLTEKDTILEAVKILREKRFTAWPDIGNYLKVIMLAKNKRIQDDFFSKWHRALSWSLLNNSYQQTSDLFIKTNLFLKEKVLFESSSVKWQFENGNWFFDFKGELPVFTLSDVRLSAYAHGDSSVIYNTSGEFAFPFDKFRGAGGEVKWYVVFNERKLVYAELDDYFLDLNVASFEADSVMFFHDEIFEEPIKGRLYERILADKIGGERQFPQFESYKQNHVLNDLFPGIRYKGGFRLAGTRIIESGPNESLASIEILKEDSLFIVAKASNFSISNQGITSGDARVSIFLAQDSIFHQQLSFRYDHSQREIFLRRDSRSSSRAPFFNSYHKMDMYCELLSWKMEEEFIEIGMMNGMQNSGEAFFESWDFFNPGSYHRLQGMNEINPLVRLSMFSRQIDSRSFLVEEFARYLRRGVEEVKNDLFNLSFLGFLTYDMVKEQITLRDKLFHFLKSNAGSSDFDVISIRSFAPVNAKVDLITYNMQLYGVQHIPLSTARNVVIYPEDNEIVLQPGRDMFFNGRIESGLFNFYGREFFFEYDEFRINLVNTDSMSFSVRSFEPDSRGRFEYIRVETVLEGINGELLVDHPVNKSGTLPYPGYPVFNSNNETYVYFNKHGEAPEAKKDGDYYFKIVPFSIDSLDNVSTENLAFNGVFHSAGILPDFFDYLTVQPDFSLGFTAVTPQGGFPVYDGLAWYDGPLNLSNEGLNANGKLRFSEATLNASNILMTPDSITGLAETFHIDNDSIESNFPQMQTSQVEVVLVKEEDKLFLATRNNSVEIFNKQVSFLGKMEMTRNHLKATGELSLFNATVVADSINFGPDYFRTGRSLMGIASVSGNSNAFSHFGYSSFFDLKNYVAHFEPEGEDAEIFFPLSQMAAKNYSYAWNLNQGVVNLTSIVKDKYPEPESASNERILSVDYDGNGVYFVSAEKDSLNFFTSGLNFDLYSGLVKAHGVPYVKVADVAFLPEDNQILVEQNAEVINLENSEIVASIENKYHKFYDVSARISSLHNYKASGFYDYINNSGKIQTINFAEIESDSTGVTQARGVISGESDFSLDPYFSFMGNVELRAVEPFLNFNGYARILTECESIRPDWFKFNSSIDPDKVFIPVEDKIKNPQGKNLALAILMAGDSTRIYSGIFSTPDHWSDKEIVSASGFISYDEYASEYRISADKNIPIPGRVNDYLSINTSECVVQGQGKINLGSELGQLTLNAFGTVTHELKKDIVDYDLVLGMDFFFSDQALDHIFSAVNDNPGLELLSLNRPKVISFLHSEMGAAKASPFVGELSLANSFKELPGPMKSTIFMGDLKLRWNPFSRSLISHGPIGVIQVNNKQLYRYVDGFFEIRKQRGGDVLTMILIPERKISDINNREWYYFTYNSGVLQTFAANNEYNNIIAGLKQKHRQMKVDRGQQPFVYILSSERRPLDFYQHMKNIENSF